MKTKRNETNPVIEIQAIADGELVTVTGGWSRGWEGGGWTPARLASPASTSWSQWQPG